MPLAGYGLKKLGVLGKPHCFVAGTQVVVGRDSDGSYITRSIEEIEEGDLILARDQFSAESPVELCRVARVYVSHTDTLRVIVLRDASGNFLRKTAMPGVECMRPGGPNGDGLRPSPHCFRQ